jgi:hypothetical protein
MDVIARSVFALDENMQRDDNSPFIRHAKAIFAVSFASLGLVIAGSSTFSEDIFSSAVSECGGYLRAIDRAICDR